MATSTVDPDGPLRRARQGVLVLLGLAVLGYLAGYWLVYSGTDAFTGLSLQRTAARWVVPLAIAYGAAWGIDAVLVYLKTE